MSNRLRFFIAALGALIIAGIFTYPLWRTPPAGEVTTGLLPELDPELQEDFRALPRSIQTGYQLMSEENPMKAVTLVTARLRTPEPADQEAPDTGNAQILAETSFGRLELPEDSDSELPAYSNLYDARGELTVYSYPDNRFVFRVEDLRVVNGPDLWAVLSTSEMPLTPDDFGRDFIELDALPANTGDMNFSIREINLNAYQSLVIYDRRYRIVFAVAPLR